MSSLKPIRRAVIGADAQGRAQIQFDGMAPNGHPSSMSSGRGHTDLWVWTASPMALAGTSDDSLQTYKFPGVPEGGHLRVVQSHGRTPDYNPTTDPEVVPFHDCCVRPGTTGTWERGGNSMFTSSMHKTQTVDYGVLLNGQRDLVLDGARTMMHPGDVVIQVGAWHQWYYPVDAQMAFDMIGADFVDGPQGVAQGQDKPLSPVPAAHWPAGVRPTRRIVTIDEADCRSVIVSDGPSPDIVIDPARPGFVAQRMWETDSAPAKIVYETLHLPRRLIPTHGGTTFRVDIVPPDSAWLHQITPQAVAEYFASMGSPQAALTSPRHPYMQHTGTFDFCTVIEGELCLVLEHTELVFKAGEVALIKGVPHAWSNRSQSAARIAISSHDGQR